MDLRRRLIVRANRVKDGALSCGRLDRTTRCRHYGWDLIIAPLPPRWCDRVAGAAPGRECLGIVGAAEADETIELSHLLDHLIRNRRQLRPGADVGSPAGDASLDGTVELTKRLGESGRCGLHHAELRQQLLLVPSFGEDPLHRRAERQVRQRLG